MIPKQENGDEAARMNVEEVLTKPVHSPFGVQRFKQRGAKPRVCGVVGWLVG